MNVSEYEFNVGDEVITIDGERGRIVDICNCEECRKRGFLEPVWENEDETEEWITYGEAKCGFKNFYKIGKYYFSPPDRDIVERAIGKYEFILARLRKHLDLIDELEGVECEEG